MNLSRQIDEGLSAIRGAIEDIKDDDRAQHKLKHELLNRVVVLEGQIHLIRERIGTCEYAAQCPAQEILDRFKSLKPTEGVTT